MMGLVLIAGLVLIFLAIYESPQPAVIQLGKFRWSQADFVRGWLITGATRSGKTAGALVPMLVQLFKNAPDWGGLCIDDKGVFSEILIRIAKAFGQQNRMAVLQVRPASAPIDWQPPLRYNLLSNSEIPSSLYAKTLIDVGGSLGGGSDKGFFRTAAQIHIEKGIDVLRALEPLGVQVSITNLYHFLIQESDMADTLELLSGSEAVIEKELAVHFVEHYLSQPQEQLGGVRSTIANYLHFFTNPRFAEVFCSGNSFDFAEIDRGKIVCVSMPNKYQAERRYVNTFLKIAFFGHALSRYDKPAEQRARDNLLVLIADEAQQTVTATESGLSDYNVIDKLGEAKATVIYATQSIISFIPPLGGSDKSNVLLLNLRNQIHFTVADQKAAELIADHIGKRTIQKKTRSIAGGKWSYSYAEADEHFIKPQALRNLKRGQCVICHCEKGFHQTQLKPTNFTVPTEAQNK